MASSTAVNNTATATVTEETSEGNEETLRLKLKKGAGKKKIQWTEDTVDNEGEFKSSISQQECPTVIFCRGLV